MARRNKQHKPVARAANSLRIIGGRWRGRTIGFPDSPGLRPTGDRVRETIFNWLQAAVPGARCLDLFAGSGAMGFEAASRGAKKVTLVESSLPVARNLIQTSARLSASDSVNVQNCPALDFIRRNENPYDIIFLDPPFGTGLHEQSLQALSQANWLAPACKIIVESPKDFAVTDFFAPDWKIQREKTAGQVRFFYLAVN